MRIVTLIFFTLTAAVAQQGLPTLAPKALPATPAASTEQLRKGFVDPPAGYRSMPLWVWNDEMDVKRIDEMLAQYKQQGIGGVFVHPRPGLMTEYLSADWFKLWRHALEQGKRLGLEVNIYDENSYPSGFAGGHVPAAAPDTAAQYVVPEFDIKTESVSAHPLTVAFIAMRRDASGAVTAAHRVNSPTEVKAGESVVAFRLRRASGNPWTGEFPYVDLTNPRTAPEFLKTTYEAYKREFGSEFGKTVKYSFTDEPYIASGGAYDNSRLGLPLSFNTLAEFRKRCGYDLADQIASLYWDVGEFRKVRFDYWQTLHDLWKENFMAPMFAWCDRNGLQFTGHWMEHEWPAPWITPSDASLYAYEHVPGIDMLEGTNLRLKGEDPHMLFTIKQVASASHQLGRRAFCEAYGVAGWDSTFEHYKRFGDWLMVHGINFMDQHLSFATVRGARKRDHPQSFSDVSPWWPYYRLHADHLARVSYLNSLSTPHNRVLVVEQSTSGFLLARRNGATPELNDMRTRNADMNQALANRQIDYDLGDEYMLEWFGKVDGKRFNVGKMSYELLVLPPDLTNLRHQTVPLIEAWLNAGGSIVSLSAPPAYVDGRPNDGPAKLAARFASQWQTVGDNAALNAAIEQRLKRRIDVDAAIGFSERFLANGDRVLFLTNTGLKPISTKASIDAGSLEAWDTTTGKTTAASFETNGGRLTFALELPPAGSLLYLARGQAAAAAKPATLALKPLETADWKAKADSTNVLAIDYCDLQVGKEKFDLINTWAANWTIWQRHGFERPAWDNAVQYKRSILDRNHFDANSGFKATFHFTVSEGMPLDSLRLAVEAPELYKISVNGKPVDFRQAQRYVDPHLLSASIAGLVKIGVNDVELAASPFDVHMELENIYILGDFYVQFASRGFALEKARTLGLGSWVQAGYPFYPGNVTYSTEVTVPAGDDTLGIDLAKWRGSLVAVALDGKEQTLLGWPPYQARLKAAPGPHTLSLKVVGTPHNLFGPLGNPTHPRMRAWPGAWAEFPEHPYPGIAYDFIDYGLLQQPVVASGREVR